MAIRQILYGFLFLCITACQQNYKCISVADLRIEYLTNPIAIEISNPLLSWNIESGKQGTVQTAYRILVSGTRENLENETGDFWDTGKVLSGQNINVRYKGAPLKTGDELFWKVKVWNKDGKESDWSKVAQWKMGLMTRDDWKAQWIGMFEDPDPISTKTHPAPFFRYETDLGKEVNSAKVYVSGLGYYELYLNGDKVGDEVLAPAQTNYDKRNLPRLLYHYDDQSTTRVFYNSFDVTRQLKKGKNAIGIVLGNGWYNQRERTVEGILWYSTPRLIFQMEVKYTDGTKEIITSNKNWKVKTGPLLHDGIFTGEVYDARLEMPGWNNSEYEDSDWQNAEVVRAPTGKLESQLAPPDKAVKSFKPKSITPDQNGRYVVDVGEMISGWIRLKIDEQEGRRVTMRFIEEMGSNYGQKDVYISAGKGEAVYEPRFTWHAFRTVEIEGLTKELSKDDIDIVAVNTDVRPAGKFTCSNELFNKIHENYIRTQLGNFHGGISSDCPHRERLGYTGDGSILVESSIYSFDMTNFYRKWVNDMDDARNKVTGFVPHTAPFGGGGGGPAWGSAYVITPWFYYLYYGETRILEEHYSGMKQWVEYLGTRTDERGVVVREEPRGWCLGDWATPAKIEIPPAYVNTCYYFYVSDLMAKISKVLGKDSEAEYFKGLAQEIKEVINTCFFDRDTKQYWEGWQGANVFALAFGIVPGEDADEVFNNLVKNIHKNRGHLDTGILATPLLLDVLTKYGRADLAYTIMDQRDFPGFGDYILGKGATTLWENWDGKSSHSHPMYGSVIRWFYQGLAGIYPDEQNPGFSNVIIQPEPCGDLRCASAEYISLNGKISSSWRLDDGDFYLDVEIPANSTATVYLPATADSEIQVNGKPFTPGGEIEFAGREGGKSVYNIGSGKYSFRAGRVSGILKQIRVSTPEIFPTDTLFTKPEKTEIILKSATPDADLRYTLDGSEPTESSELYVSPLELSDAAVLTAKAFKQGYIESYSKTGQVRFIDPDRNGLQYTVYEGEWESRPDLKKLKTVSRGKQYDFNVNRIKKREDYIAIVFEGFIEICTPGLYTFYSAANDGSWLYVNNKLVVDNTQDNHSGNQKGKIRLNTGIYPIKVIYYENSGTEALNVAIEGPGIDKQGIDPSTLFLYDQNAGN